MAVASLLLVSCNKGPLGTTEDSIARAKIEALEARVDSVRDMIPIEQTGAFLKTASNGDFAIGKTDIGVLTFSIDDITAFADGSKVTVQIGNPTSAKITQLKSTIYYGSLDEKGQPAVDGMKLEQTISKPLLPGSWTKLILTLGGVPPTKLGYVTFGSLSVQSMTLNTTN